MLLMSGAHMRLKRAFRQRIISSVMSSGLCPAYLWRPFAPQPAASSSGKATRCCGFSAHTFCAAALSETTSVSDARAGIKKRLRVLILRLRIQAAL
jgi:hypothetical protein